MDEYIVEYNGWSIPVEAKNIKSARYKAWKEFNAKYGTDFIDFMRGIDGVRKAS